MITQLQVVQLAEFLTYQQTLVGENKVSVMFEPLPINLEQSAGHHIRLTSEVGT